MTLTATTFLERLGRPICLFIAAAALAFAAPVQAQTVEVFDDFEDGDVSEYFTFNGATGVGLGTGSEVPMNNGGSVSLTADFGTGSGGFIGGFGKENVNSDITAFSEPRLNFYYKFNAGSPNTAFTIEANVQEDENGDGQYNPNDDDEFRILIRVNGAKDYRLASAAISRGLLNQNGQAGGDGVFNGTVNGVVFAINGATADDGSGDAEGGQLVLDYISFTDGDALETPPFTSSNTYDDFEDNDVSEYFTFDGATGVGLSTSSDVPSENGGSFALAADFDTGSGGFIGGFGKNDINADLTSYDTPRLNFYYKFDARTPITEFVLEANVQEDEDGNGTYEGAADDEFRAKLRITDASTYGFISVEIDALERNLNGQAGGDGVFNGTVAGVVFAINGATADDGSGDAEGGRLLIDAITFTSGGPLPVEFAGFDVRAAGNDAILNWQTLTEINNDRFDVQVASKGASFRTVGTVRGAGTTTEMQRYQFRVPSLQPGVHQFRLRQVDVDGTQSLSDVRTLVIGTDEAFTMLKRSVNPVRSGEVAQFSYIVKEREPVRVELYNVLGQRVQTVRSGMSAPGAESTVRINTSDLSSGMYFLRITGQSFAQTERLSVVR